MSVVEICLVTWRDVGKWDLFILFLKGKHISHISDISWKWDAFMLL
jgi:hypothetical protein